MPVMSVQWKGLSPMSLRAPVRATACCLHTALLYLCQSRAGVPNFLSEAVEEDGAGTRIETLHWGLLEAGTMS